ncbi:MAG: GrpB family protein [Erysipelotrichaceae bacterium]|nr:GrpB family protein [Erysipelotrichaceae bacterium]
MKTGLRRGTVRLEKHQPSWTRNAEETIFSLSRILEGAAKKIEHVGSTAVSSIKAKPIIDIVIGTDDFEKILEKDDQLKKEGFILRQDERPEQLLYVRGDLNRDFITHHIHVVLYNSKQWNNYLDFRDYLDSNEEIAKRYESLKEELAEIYPTDRKSYTEAKSGFIAKLLIEAKKWREEDSK